MAGEEDLVATLLGDPAWMLSNDGVNLRIPLEQVGRLEHAGDSGHGLGGREAEHDSLRVQTAVVERRGYDPVGDLAGRDYALGLQDRKKLSPNLEGAIHKSVGWVLVSASTVDLGPKNGVRDGGLRGVDAERGLHGELQGAIIPRLHSNPPVHPEATDSVSGAHGLETSDIGSAPLAKVLSFSEDECLVPAWGQVRDIGLGDHGTESGTQDVAAADVHENAFKAHP
jgi:hypothetical protein